MAGVIVERGEEKAAAMMERCMEIARKLGVDTGRYGYHSSPAHNDTSKSQ